MFYLKRESDGIIEQSCKNYMKSKGYITLDSKNLSEEDKLFVQEFENGSQKERDIQEFKNLVEKGLKNDSKYDSLKKIPVELNPTRDHELNILDERGIELTKEIMSLKAKLIENYGIEVLEETF